MVSFRAKTTERPSASTTNPKSTGKDSCSGAGFQCIQRCHDRSTPEARQGANRGDQGTQKTTGGGLWALVHTIVRSPPWCRIVLPTPCVLKPISCTEITKNSAVVHYR